MNAHHIISSPSGWGTCAHALRSVSGKLFHGEIAQIHGEEIGNVERAGNRPYLSVARLNVARAGVAHAIAMSARIDLAQAKAKSGGPAVAPGLGFDELRNSLSPIFDVIAYPVYVVAHFFDFLLSNPPAATMFSTAAAAALALFSIRKQRESARLKETFNAITKSTWDKDIIDARVSAANLRNELSSSGQSIAKFAIPAKKDTEIAGKLYNILNDYENLSLAVRMGIIDEVYLYRWTRGTLISDWDYLSPLVIALRHERKSQFLYIEFEGIAAAWQQNRSYKTGRLMNSVARKISIT